MLLATERTFAGRSARRRDDDNLSILLKSPGFPLDHSRQRVSVATPNTEGIEILQKADGMPRAL